MRVLKIFGVFLLVSIIIVYNTYSQKEGNNWYFGRYAGLNFNSGNPIILTNSAMFARAGCASISEWQWEFIILYRWRYSL